MGHCASRDQKEQKKLNRRIEEQIRKDQSISLRIIKLLLLGAGESGKSTILKQMRILHKDGFSKHDLESIRWVNGWVSGEKSLNGAGAFCHMSPCSYTTKPITIKTSPGQGKNRLHSPFHPNECCLA